MTTKSRLALVVIILLAIAGLTGYAQKPNPKVQIWEYKTVHSSTLGSSAEKTFNELGAQSWELVTASGASDYSGIMYVFKRAK